MQMLRDMYMRGAVHMLRDMLLAMLFQVIIFKR